MFSWAHVLVEFFLFVLLQFGFRLWYFPLVTNAHVVRSGDVLGDAVTSGKGGAHSKARTSGSVLWKCQVGFVIPAKTSVRPLLLLQSPLFPPAPPSLQGSCSFPYRGGGAEAIAHVLCPPFLSQGTVFALDSEEEEYPGLIAEDSNDIYILTSDNSGQVSPPESPTVTTSWQSESLPVSLSASQSWHTESLPVSLGPESWQQVAMDPEEVKSLDSNGGGEERSENNSSNSDIVHVEKEEIPEGIEEAVVSAVAAETVQAALPETPASSQEAKPQADVTAVEKAKAHPSALLRTEQEEKGKVAEELVEPEIPVLSKPVPKLAPSEEKAAPEPEKIMPPGEKKVGKEGRSEEIEEKSSAEEKPILLPEGKSILLYGGAAAVAILAVAVGVALALRKK